jgi:hypothetical protein
MSVRSPRYNSWEDVETAFEDGKFACRLSKNPYLNTFIRIIFVKTVSLLHSAFLHFKIDIEHLYTLLKPIYHVIGTKKYLLRPGIEVRGDEAAYRAAIYQVAVNKCISKTLDECSLNQFMGAIYHVTTSKRLVGIILLYKQHVATFNPGSKTNSTVIMKLLGFIKEVFYLPDSFSVGDLVEFVGTPTMGADPENIDFLLDFCLFKLPDSKKLSVVRRNLNNLSYIRVRVGDKTMSSYSTSSLTTSEDCPKFADNIANMVEGDSYYNVPQNSLFRKLCEKYNRRVKAGISGSTIMWMNFCFFVLDIEASRANTELLLLCIIADFVPKYHSLTEVIMAYNREVSMYKRVELSCGRFQGCGDYDISVNPVQWLLKELSMLANLPGTAAVTYHQYDKSLDVAIKEVYRIVHVENEQFLQDMCNGTKSTSTKRVLRSMVPKSSK